MIMSHKRQSPLQWKEPPDLTIPRLTVRAVVRVATTAAARFLTPLHSPTSRRLEKDELWISHGQPCSRQLGMRP